MTNQIKLGYPPQQYPPQTLQPPNMLQPPQQYPPQQYPPQQYPPQQYPPQQYPPQQYPPQQYPPQQFPPQQYPPQHMQQPPKMMGAMYEFHFAGQKLDRKDITSKSDPFLILSRPRDLHTIPTSYKTQSGSQINTFGDWVVVHKTEWILNNQNPTWKPFKLNLGELCFNNLDCPFLIECYDYDDNGKHDFIGSVKTTIRGFLYFFYFYFFFIFYFLEMQVMKEMQLRNPKRLGFGQVSGVLKVVKCSPC